jgi:hypothetical protein
MAMTNFMVTFLGAFYEDVNDIDAQEEYTISLPLTFNPYDDREAQVFMALCKYVKEQEDPLLLALKNELTKHNIMIAQYNLYEWSILSVINSDIKEIVYHIENDDVALNELAYDTMIIEKKGV